jgi:hypothetical protein
MIYPLGRKKCGIIFGVHCAKLCVFDDVIILGGIEPIIGDFGIHILGAVSKTFFEYLAEIHIE